MSHDVEAAYASSEVAELMMVNQARFFGTMGTAGAWSVFAGREGGHQWPLADGVLCAQNPTARDVNIAFEFKRPNEGVHGILTALGQSYAYMEKGYDASIMVIPERFSSHPAPGEYVRRVIDAVSPDIPISIYTYSTPDLSATRPFKGKLRCVREISLPACRGIARAAAGTATSGSVSTLWAHMREGMSHPDAFYRYCQAVKIISATGDNLDNIRVPGELESAVRRINPNADVHQYLSSTPGDSISDKAWRYVWFNDYFWNDLMPIYSSAAPYTVNAVATKIRIDDEHFQNLFSGRVDSIKSKLVRKLNEGTITLPDAWEEYARKVRSDAHSYREVIDSGLYHIGFVAPDGHLTDLGYQYVEACERIGTPYAGIPLEILRASILQNGQYGAMLHYFYKLSEEKFSDDLFAFTQVDSRGNRVFKSQDYLNWLDDVFANELHLSKKSTVRAGGTRKSFQAELYCLKRMGFVKQREGKAAYRVGVGLEIDWPQVQSSLVYFQGL